MGNIQLSDQYHLTPVVYQDKVYLQVLFYRSRYSPVFITSKKKTNGRRHRLFCFPLVLFVPACPNSLFLPIPVIVKRSTNPFIVINPFCIIRNKDHLYLLFWNNTYRPYSTSQRVPQYHHFLKSDHFSNWDPNISNLSLAFDRLLKQTLLNCTFRIPRKQSFLWVHFIHAILAYYF